MIYSPLRYPGGKAKLAPFMGLMIDKINLANATYVEPFAGGAGIALDLLFNGVVENVVINDYDRAIYSFWRAVLTENERFIDSIYRVPVTTEEWFRQKEIYLNHNNKYSFELGFSTFFLNRTNRSGIIKGGMIGGNQQNGKWKIDARFNRENLASRVEKIGERKADIKLYYSDVVKFIVNYLPKYENNAFVYFDPPYYKKGRQLYKNFFQNKHHQMIEKYITENVKSNWIVTYDDVPEIIEIYKKYKIKRFDLNYSASKNRIASEIMIFQNQDMCPTNEELALRDININLR